MEKQKTKSDGNATDERVRRGGGREEVRYDAKKEEGGEEYADDVDFDDVAWCDKK